MAYLLDTGILLRLIDRHDPRHAIVNAAAGLLGNRRQVLFITTQNIAEFCNVATRPVVNNGLGLAPNDPWTFSSMKSNRSAPHWRNRRLFTPN
jgi:predicted nucleic acid-binding protein